MTEIIKKVLKTPGISGREQKIADTLRELIAPYADETKIDALGNLIAYKKGSAENRKKIMLAAHMDEIGFMATFIDDNGFVRVSNIGGISWTAAAYSRVMFENGTRGVIVPEQGVAANDFSAQKFVIDIGAKNKKEAEKKVKIGDAASIVPELDRLCGKRYAGRPFDDRIGCAVLIDAAAHMSKCPNDVYFTFTVQEEVGCRGARTAAFGIAPDIAIAYDVTGTGDAVGSRPMAVKLGDGAAIKVKDSSVICDARLVDALCAMAKDGGIAYQLELLEYGGTDTSTMQAAGAGTVAGCISIPTRYIHSAVETLDMRDVEAASELTVKIIENGIEL
ncbi:MAG: M42 family metallopeptidase [Eubacteriales bacterium]